MRGLAGWLEQHAPELGPVRAARFPDEGGSSFNLMFETEPVGGGSASYVAKLGSPGPSFMTFPDESLSRQRRVVDLVRSAVGLPAPEVLHYEEDVSWLGAAFYIMPRYAGRPWPSDPPYTFAGWVKEATPDERRAMQSSFVEVLARLHMVTTANADLEFLRREDLGASPLAAQVGYLDNLYHWARRGVRFPLVERALAWLTEHLPIRHEPGCLTWGDARAGNLLFDGHRVTTVLDWEGASIGQPEIDLTFAEVMHRYYQQRAESLGKCGLPDVFRGEDLAAEYAGLTGREPRDLAWHRILAATRAAAIQVRFVRRPVPSREREPTDAIADDRLTIGTLLSQLLDDAGAGPT